MLEPDAAHQPALSRPEDLPFCATRRLIVDPERPDAAVIAAAAALLRRGGLVAFPTETVYGLGAHALDAAAVRRIFAAKRRPAYDPLIVHVAHTRAQPADLAALAQELPEAARALVAHFWPGPLTLVLRRTARVPAVVTAGGPTVAVRAPSHPLALALLRAAALPVAAPSANLFGHTSPTTAQHVWDDLAGRIELLLDGGPTPIGVESTVLDVSGARPTLLRPGGVTQEQIEAVVGPIERRAPAQPDADAVLASPGLLERHYAPRTPMTLVAGARRPALAALRVLVQQAQAAGRVPVLLLYEEDVRLLEQTGAALVQLGPEGDLAAVARRLYSALREADALRADLLLAREPVPEGLGAALRDRLRRAAARVETVAA